MKIIYKDKVNCIIRFDRDDEFIAKLSEFCKEHSIKAGWLNALGACKQLQLAYYNLETKEYENHDITENLEVVGISGNIGIYKNEQIVHAHGSFGDNNLQTISGHINSLVVSATLEVNLTILQGEITRELDPDTCLKLMV